MKVALVGKAGSGKTTLAMALVKDFGFVKLSFADKLKEFATAILLEPIDKERDREFLQLMGDGARRSIIDIWIKWLHFKLQSLERSGVIDFVVDDCRYLNEVEWLRKQGFIIVKLVGRSYKLPAHITEHPSEVEMDKIKADIEVDASGSVKEMCEDFRKKLFRLKSLRTRLRMYALEPNRRDLDE